MVMRLAMRAWKFRSNHTLRTVSLFAILIIGVTSCKELAFWKHPTVSFTVVGDIMGHEAQIRSAYDQASKQYHYEPVFAPLGDRISRADISIGNLELTLPGKPELYSGYPQFGSPDALVTALKGMGFKLLVTANNHCMDKGFDGAKRTIEVVRSAGILQTGTFVESDYQTRRILEVEKNDMRIVFLNYTYSTNDIPVPPGIVVNLIEKERILKDFELARAKKPDLIVVLYHFGKEYENAPNDDQKQWADLAFQEGAQIVLGGHPHTLQPFERKVTTDRFGKKAERFVIWSMGNFVSNMQRRYVDGGIILNFAVMKNGEDIVIRNINYEPIWVYTPIENGRLQFYVVPALDYVKAGKFDALWLARVKEFLRDTDTLLKGSVAAVKDPE